MTRNDGTVAGDGERESTSGALTTSATNNGTPSTSTSNGTTAVKNDPAWRYVIVGGSLIPPTNFGQIEENMYRSGMANELNYPFLERLSLRSIVYLASDDPSDKLTDFMEDQRIFLHHLATHDTVSEPISEQTVLLAMNVLLDTSLHPVLVMCSHGRHRTGTVIGCLRKLQMWSLSAIFEEYDRHADGRGRLANEQFIELFDTDLINVPSANQPPWLR